MLDASTLDKFGTLVGGSPQMRSVFAMIEKAARIDVPVLISGETGTGKELVAREIHVRGRRTAAPFVAVNTGALSIQLVASELFGHIRGSFTGAVENKAGRFAEADGGTLFLDEIATMDERVQIALLRVLETNSFRPVGAKRDKTVDVRLLAATNTDLRHAVKTGVFREDVLHRLEVFSINLPPLRDHIEDVPMLAAHLVDLINSDFSLQIESVADDAVECLLAYRWPGNIRELKNVLAQAAVMAECAQITTEHLPARIVAPAAARSHAHAGPAAPPPAPKPVEQNIPAAAQTYYGADSPEPPCDGIFLNVGEPLDEVMKAYVLKTLAHCSYNKTHAAQTLGVSRKTLYDKLLQWGMEKRRV